MPGPNVQMPGPLSEVFDLERDENGNVRDIRMRTQWAAYFSTIAQLAHGSTRSGSTNARPAHTSSSAMLRWKGQPYFDDELQKMIFLKHASTNVWVTSDGTEV
jgi:hypothetical protein